MAVGPPRRTELEDRPGISFRVDAAHIGTPLPDDAPAVVVDVVRQPGGGEEVTVGAGDVEHAFLRDHMGALRPVEPVDDVPEWARTALERVGAGTVRL